jgi:hypothetical protein
MSDTAVRDELARLTAVHGVLRAEDVVQAARDPASPLHDRFEWDDEKAAEQHRLAQARTLIRTVTIEIKSSTISLSVPAYVSTPGARSGYSLLTQIRGDDAAARQALLTEIERAQAAIRRAQAVAAGLGLDAPVADLLTGLDALRALANGQPQPPPVAPQAAH